MKITYFNYLYDLYGMSLGSTIKAIELFRAVGKLGHSVHIHWRKEKEVDETHGSKRYRFILKKRLYKYLHEPNQILRNLNYLREEFSILQNNKPDVLIARLDSHVFSPPILSRHFQLPYIAEVDSPVMYEIRHFAKFYYSPYGLLDRLEMAFILNASKAFCVSQQLKQHYVERGVPSNHLTVIPNGADISRFHPDTLNHTMRENLKIDDYVVIGFIGSFQLWHGVEQLKALIDALLTRHDRAAFLLVGKGRPMQRSLQQYVQSRKIANRVCMIEYVPHHEIPALIHAMDIVLAPYPYLPFFYYSPVKIYEYLACGKPVVASRIGQIPEIIEHRKNGMLCEPGNIQEFIDCIDQLINNTGLRKDIGQAAADDILKHHTWHHRASQLLSLIEKAG
ncbi:glycosyltransferase family 4 protein [bacterium]|nr:glycosyltransferase family 4 protein [bacterium]